MAPSERPLMSCWRNSDIVPCQAFSYKRVIEQECAVAVKSRLDIFQKFELTVFDRDDDSGFRRVPLGVQFGSTGCADEVGLGDGVSQLRPFGRACALDRVSKHQRGVVTEGGHGIGSLSAVFC